MPARRLVERPCRSYTCVLQGTATLTGALCYGSTIRPDTRAGTKLRLYDGMNPEKEAFDRRFCPALDGFVVNAGQ